MHIAPLALPPIPHRPAACDGRTRMAADFYIDTSCGVVFSKAAGTLTRGDLRDHMERLRSHPDFRPEMAQLADFRDVTQVEVTCAEIKQLAAHPLYNGRARRAFVVSSDVQFGLGRMFAAYREMRGSEEIVIFKDMSEALAWLSVPQEPDRERFPRLREAAGLDLAVPAE